MSRRGLALLAFALIAAGAALSSERVWWHGQWDQTDASTVAPQAVEAEADGQDWVAVGLLATEAREQDVFLSVCAGESLASIDVARVGARLVVSGGPAESEPAVLWQKGPLTEAAIGAGAPDNCLFFNGRGAVGGGLVELVWRPGAYGELGELEVSAAVRHPLQWPDRAVLTLLLLGLGLLLYAGQRTEPAEEAAPWTAWDAVIVIGVWFFSSLFLAALGASQGAVFLAGLLHVGAYVTACWVMAERLVPGKPLVALSFVRIQPIVWSVSGAVGLGLAVVVSVLLIVLPQGESHMTQVLQTSGGLVSVLTLALISPWAEELLLRGVLYGALERRAGPAAAVIGSAAVFSLLHLGQHWGNLAPWVMLTVTGLVLSLVRWRTGSTLASTVTHFIYNLTLALPVLWVG